MRATHKKWQCCVLGLSLYYQQTKPAQDWSKASVKMLTLPCSMTARLPYMRHLQHCWVHPKTLVRPTSNVCSKVLAYVRCALINIPIYTLDSCS